MEVTLVGFWRLKDLFTTKRAAFLWICPACLMWVTCCGFQIVELYSTFGHTQDWYALSLMTLGQCLRLRLTNTSILDAFEVILSMCRTEVIRHIVWKFYYQIWKAFHNLQWLIFHLIVKFRFISQCSEVHDCTLINVKFHLPCITAWHFLLENLL